MKKTILFILMCMVVLSMSAQKKNSRQRTVQKKHITFLGVPFGIPLEDFKSELRKKGFSDSTTKNHMTGNFWELRDATLEIYSDNNIVSFTIIEMSEYKYIKLVEEMRKKYGMPKKYDDGSDHQYYWDVEGGRIVISDFLDKVFSIQHWDYTKVDKVEKFRKSKVLKSPSNDL